MSSNWAVTLVLAALAALSLGLAISAWAKRTDQAVSLVPLALLPQIVFAGQIFPIETPLTEVLAALMISRWTMDALGSTANLNALCPLPNLNDDGMLPPRCDPGPPPLDESFTAAFLHTPEHLLLTWGVLLAFVVALLGITIWLLRRSE
ncbi:MAG: ABC transporter permease [Chloroflexaceae bacterium]|nr:ABC transporter permease [Chloroflexaceae bacterium]